MKRLTAVICLFIFANLAVAHPFSSGGGGSSSADDESNLAIILMTVVLVGVSALFVTDILADKSQNTSSVNTDEIESEETGVNWEQLSNNSDEDSLPLMALSIFPGENGRNLAAYFSSLINQGDGIYFDNYSAPVSFGQMDPVEAAETGFSFLNCQWFIATTVSGFELYSEDTDRPIWTFQASTWDSLMVREAASSFLDFSRNI